jgi:multiple sugar transport system substrate-binding protein
MRSTAEPPGHFRVCAVGLMLAALLLCGCGRRAAPPPPSPPPPATTLSFAYWALSPTEINTVHELVGEFERTHPNVQVRLIEVTDRYYDKLTTMFAARTGPDVFSVNYGRLGDFARHGLVADLAPLVRGHEGLQAGTFVGAAWEAFSNIGEALGKPGLWGLPRDWGPTNLLMYNRQLLAAAGVEEPAPQWTWKQFAQACHKLTAKTADGSTRFGAAVCLYPYAAGAWIAQAGGDLRRHKDGAWLNTQECAEALGFLRGLVDEGAIAPADPAHDQSLTQFQTGRAALAFATPYSLGELRRKEGLQWGVAPPPVGRRQATGCIPTGIAVSAACARKDLAAEFVEFWVTEGAQRVARAGFCVPAWRQALSGPALEEGFGAQTAQVLREAAGYARPIPVARELPYETLQTELRKALDAIFVRSESPSDALQAANRRLTDAAAARREGP